MIINFKGAGKVGVRMKVKTPTYILSGTWAQLLQFKLGEGGGAGLTAEGCPSVELTATVSLY